MENLLIWSETGEGSQISKIVNGTFLIMSDDIKKMFETDQDQNAISYG